MSRHFKPKEFACQCCSISHVDPLLVAALEQYRIDAGERPVFVLCGCRCPSRNAEVGGAKDSRHLITDTRACDAADIRVPGLSIPEMYFVACKVKAFNKGGIGIYADKGFIHVDCRPKRARWGHMSGRYVTFDMAWKAIQREAGIPT